MCDASGYAVGALLGQSKDKNHYAVSYASKNLTGPQLNYTTMKMDLFAMVFAIKKLDHIWWALRRCIIASETWKILERYHS
jgi:hypothetical protein